MQGQTRWLNYLFVLSRDHDLAFEAYLEAIVTSAKSRQVAQETSDTLAIFILLRKIALLKVKADRKEERELSHFLPPEELVKGFWEQADMLERELIYLSLIEELNMDDLRVVTHLGGGLEVRLDTIFRDLNKIISQSDATTHAQAVKLSFELAYDPRERLLEKLLQKGKLDEDISFANPATKIRFERYKEIRAQFLKLIHIDHSLRLPRDVRNKLAIELKRRVGESVVKPFTSRERQAMLGSLLLAILLGALLVWQKVSLKISLPPEVQTYKLVLFLLLASLAWTFNRQQILRRYESRLLTNGAAAAILWEVSCLLNDSSAPLYALSYVGSAYLFYRFRRDMERKELEQRLRENRQILQLNSMQGDYYDAFISYRHLPLDDKVAAKLYQLLTDYKTPENLVEEGYSPFFKSIFRDQEELAANSNLEKILTDSLVKSDFLIVVCSTETPLSEWVCKEIEVFKALGRQNRILAVLVSGDPGQSFPKPLTEQNLGHKIVRVEPLALDVRAASDQQVLENLSREYVRLVSTMMGFSYNKLNKGETKAEGKGEFDETDKTSTSRFPSLPKVRLLYALPILVFLLLALTLLLRLGFLNGAIQFHTRQEGMQIHLVEGSNKIPVGIQKIFECLPGSRKFQFSSEFFITVNKKIWISPRSKLSMDVPELKPKQLLLEVKSRLPISVKWSGYEQRLPFQEEIRLDEPVLFTLLEAGTSFARYQCSLEYSLRKDNKPIEVYSSEAKIVFLSLEIDRKFIQEFCHQ